MFQKDLTYDCKDESVGEVAVKGELNHISPKPQKLHGLSQAYEYVTRCQGQNRELTVKLNHTFHI